ncbi:MAG: NAD-dependent epimerase/dehydratase family protein [Pirellulaceae bacterium]
MNDESGRSLLETRAGCSVFVTGAAGFVGRELVGQCRRLGIDVVAVDIADPSGGDWFVGDIRSRSVGDLIPEQVDAVIHLAGLTRDPDCRDRGYDCFDANVMATLNLMDAAQKRRAKQFIFASTEWVYGESEGGAPLAEDAVIDIARMTSEYALSKLVSEANLRQKCLRGFCPTTVLRFGIIYGSRRTNWSAVEAIFNMVKTQDVVTVGSLKTGRHFVHVSDIASGVLKAVGRTDCNTFNLEGERLVTLENIIEESRKILQRNPEVVEKTPAAGSVRDISNRKAAEVLGWRPTVDLATGLRQLNAFLAE